MGPFINQLYLFFASGFGVGFIAFKLVGGLRRFSFITFPETWSGAGLFGTLLGGTLIYFGLNVQGSAGLFWLILATVRSFHIAGKAEKILQVKDPSQIVVDEIIGIYWATSCLPPGALNGDEKFSVLAAAFILFRIFDVFKLPLKHAQNLKGGLGVVMDDLLAGLLANGILQLILRWNGSK